MTDPYHPPLADFTYTEAEHNAIQLALQTDDPWLHGAEVLAAVSDTLRQLKDRLRDHHLARHQHTCCYCRSNLYGGGRFSIDREHILPKEQFPAFSYRVENLAVACKRCNMQFKGRSLSFLAVPSAQVTQVPGERAWFKFVHPNLDAWGSHLHRYAQQIGTHNFVAYKVIGNSAKGQWTWEFFGLGQLEVDSFDRAQGVETLSEEELKIMEMFRQLVGNVP